MMGDVLEADEWAVQVVEGRASEVDLLDPAGGRALPVEFRIGDGSIAQLNSGTGFDAVRKVDNVTMGRFGEKSSSEEPLKPRYKVDLIPRSRGQLSFVSPHWEELDRDQRIVLSNVSPGEYRLRVLDWLGSRDFDNGVLFEQDITMPTEKLPINVSLGAGCITGRVLNVGRYDANADIIAVPEEGKGSARRTRCDGSGNFCVRYLEEAAYTLFAHDPRQGWARFENIKVTSNMIDVGERRLGEGGTIRGVITFERSTAIPDEVVVTGPSGLVLRLPFDTASSFDRFDIAGLWPGVWVITVRSGDHVLATGRAEISGSESVGIELAAGTGSRP